MFNRCRPAEAIERHTGASYIHIPGALLEFAPPTQVVKKSLVILFEECVVFFASSLNRKTMRESPFHQDLFYLRIVFKNLHHLRDEII